jgi:tetratricopeptide (TPR) repeat protein
MSTPESMTVHHPSDETLAAFVDKRLDAQDRRSVIEHMSDCGECRDTVLSATRFQAAISDERASRWSTWRVSAIAAAALIVVLLGSLLWRRSQSSSDMEAIVAASAPLKYRPSMARLSADFPYREPQPRYRTGSRDDSISEESLSLLAAAAQIEEDAGETPSSSQLHALGVAYLLSGRTDEAIAALERALTKETGTDLDRIGAIQHSKNAALLNDLAAAYYTAMDRKGDQSVQSAAVQAVQTAWKLEKTPQIAWTRAVVLETLEVREQSIAAWRDYLALDSGSEWSVDAQRRLKEIMEPADAAV